MLQLFQGSFIFGETASSHLLSVTTSIYQLLVQSSYFVRTAAFFEEPLFQKKHYFPAVIFSE